MSAGGSTAKVLLTGSSRPLEVRSPSGDLGIGSDVKLGNRAPITLHEASPAGAPEEKRLGPPL